jgi:hypothetical protein
MIAGGFLQTSGRRAICISQGGSKDFLVSHAESDDGMLTNDFPGSLGNSGNKKI